MKLTQAAISKVKREAAGKNDHIEWDDALPGFGLRIRNGRATWIVQYKIGSRHRRITLGTTEMLTADQARNGWKTDAGGKHDGAAKIMTNARDGFDAAVSRVSRRKQVANTLDTSIASYLKAKEAVLRPRTYLESKRHLIEHWKPLHGFSLGAINKERVSLQLDGIARGSGPVAANRARATLSAMFKWAIGKGLCDDNPVLGTNKRQESVPRERSLSDDEIVAVWAAAPENDYGRIVRLILLTGCRRAEIGALRWSEIDLEKSTITLPEERTKNNTEHQIPLSDVALATLRGLAPREDRDFVFGLGRGGYSGWSKAKRELDKSAKLKSPWTLDDLRRTVRTGMGQLGVLPHVAEAVLNHLPPKLIRSYDRNSYAVEKKAALDAWTHHIESIVSPSKSTSVSVRAKSIEVVEAESRRATFAQRLASMIAEKNLNQRDLRSPQS